MNVQTLLNYIPRCNVTGMYLNCTMECSEECYEHLLCSMAMFNVGKTLDLTRLNNDNEWEFIMGMRYLPN